MVRGYGVSEGFHEAETCSSQSHHTVGAEHLHLTMHYLVENSGH